MENLENNTAVTTNNDEIDLSLIDKSLINVAIKNSLPIMRRWCEAQDEFIDDLYDVVNTHATEIDSGILDEADSTLKLFSNSLMSDIFSSTNLNELFDTPSVDAFVGEAVKYIALYRQSSITAPHLASTIIDAFCKVAEYLNKIYAALDKQQMDVYIKYRKNADEETNELIDLFLSERMLEVAKESEAYGVSFTDYKNMIIKDEDGEDETDSDSDFDSDAESADEGNSGVRSTLNAIGFNVNNMLN